MHDSSSSSSMSGPSHGHNNQHQHHHHDVLAQWEELERRRQAIVEQRQALEVVIHQQQHQQQSHNIQDKAEEKAHRAQKLGAMRHQFQRTQSRNVAILREVDLAKALVQEHREQEHHNGNDDDIDSINCRQRLAMAKRAFMRVVEDELGMLPASWQEKICEVSVTGVGAEERQQQQQQRRQSTFELAEELQQQRETEERPMLQGSPPIGRSEEEEEEQELNRWNGASSAAAPPPPPKPGRPHLRGSPPFVTPSSDPYAAAATAAATASSLQHAPQQQRKSLLLPEWGRRQGYQGKDGASTNIPDIRDMTSEERLTVVTHLIKLIENSSSAAAVDGGSSFPPSLPRLGYPKEWDGRITRAVLELEQNIYQDIKAGQPLRHPSSLPASQQQQQQQQQQLYCLTLLHTLRFSARELLPLDLLTGVMDEAKIAKYHRRVRRAAGMWVVFRRHLRCLLGGGVMMLVEIRLVFGEALLGDMSKRERGEVLRLRGKVGLLLESMGRGVMEEVEEEREKEKEKERGGVVAAPLVGKERGGMITRKSSSSSSSSISISSSSSSSSSSKSKNKPDVASSPGKKGFLSRVLRWE